MENITIRPITAADDEHMGAIARELGYARLYLETHSNLKAAIHL